MTGYRVERTGWKSIMIAPKDGTVIRARGWDLNDRTRKRHYVFARWKKGTLQWHGQEAWYSLGGDTRLDYLVEWKPTYSVDNSTLGDAT